MPSAAARARVARWAARRWAGVTEVRAAARTRWWASRVSQPESSKPAAPRAAGTAASSAEDTTAECTSIRVR